MAETTTTLDGTAIKLISELATEAATAEVVTLNTEGLGKGLPDEIQIGFDAKTQRFHSLKSLIEEYRVAPDERRGTARADTLDSFVDLIDRHKDENSVIFGKTTWPKPALTAVLNYDREGVDARRRDHRVAYEFPLTEEFKAWVNNSGVAMGQDVFAAFLEEHAAELAAPMDGEVSEYERLFKEHFATPSEVLELSRHLEVFVASKAKQGVRLQTGERVVEFIEEHQNAKGEKVTIPGIFMVSVPAFIDGEAVRIPARLRYRIAGGDIKWFYQLYRWEFFLREQVGRDLRESAERTGLPSFEGSPEA
ncbi:DUF2303 family protein [Aliihoeflea sp. PC F10.4]